MRTLIAIFVGVSIAWLFLGNTVEMRTHSQDQTLKYEVGQLWGTAQGQKAPMVQLNIVKESQVTKTVDGKKVTETKAEKVTHRLPIDGSRINTDLEIDYRQKGLLWYSTYRVNFSGEYETVNNTGEQDEAQITFEFPNSGAIYDDFRFLVNGKELENLDIEAGKVTGVVNLAPGEAQNFLISYKSQGMDEWWYDFGEDVNQIRNFSLTMNTDFKEIDFPQNSISPTKKVETDKGWELS
ncbi:MAG: inner membrane CreD family protein [Clostridia bacterium]|nr:inner membrane CreD family protein [Clostridia bacterium]